MSIIALPRTNNDFRVIRVSLDSVGKLAVILNSLAVIDILIDLTNRYRRAFDHREASPEYVSL